MYPKVSIIILNWNGKAYLKDCLTSVLAQSYPNYEVIFVDNGSKDGSVEYVRAEFPNVKLVLNEMNFGFSRGNNIAIKTCTGAYVVTLNNDTIVAPNWLAALVTVADSDRRIGSCQSKILSLKAPSIIDAVGIGIKKNGGAYQIGNCEKDQGQYENIQEVFGACAGSALYRREMLEQIGLFDEDFFAYYEDVDLSWRARLFGWQCMYVPGSIVYHIGSATGNPIKSRFLARNVLFYILKNAPARMVLYRLLISLLSIPLTILWGVIKREHKYMYSKLKGTGEGFRAIPRSLRKRRKIQSAKSCSNHELRRWFK